MLQLTFSVRNKHFQQSKQFTVLQNKQFTTTKDLTIVEHQENSQQFLLNWSFDCKLWDGLREIPEMSLRPN